MSQQRTPFCVFIIKKNPEHWLNSKFSLVKISTHKKLYFKFNQPTQFWKNWSHIWRKQNFKRKITKSWFFSCQGFIWGFQTAKSMSFPCSTMFRQLKTIVLICFWCFAHCLQPNWKKQPNSTKTGMPICTA